MFLPPCTCGGDVRAYHRVIEELYHMRGLAGFRQELQERFEHAGAAEPPESLPDAVPVAELGRQRPPGDAVHCEVMQCFQELAIIAPGFASL
jgi:hypothetical protein